MNTIYCVVCSESRGRSILDREVDTMSRSLGPLRQKLFRYVRYNAELTKEGLAALGCTDVDPEVVQKLDSIDAIPALERVGKAAAQRQVDASHFNFEVFRP